MSDGCLFGNGALQIGVLYYALVKDPIDLDTIRDKIEATAYCRPAEFEADMRLLFRVGKTARSLRQNHG